MRAVTVRAALYPINRFAPTSAAKLVRYSAVSPTAESRSFTSKRLLHGTSVWRECPIHPTVSNHARSSNNAVVIQSVSEVETKLMRENAAQLLATPLGKMESTQWYDAEDTFKWWISQRTKESVNISMELFHRFVQETQHDEEEAAIDNLNLFLDQRVMITLLVNWQAVWKKNKEKEDRDNQEMSWTPTRLLKALDEWAQVAPKVNAMRITGMMLSYIISGLLYGINPANAAEEADQLLTHYLNRRTRLSQVSLLLVNSVLNVWSKSGRSDAVDRAEDIFSRVKRSPVGGNLDVITYNTLLDVYSQAGYAERAEGLLEAMAQDCQLQQQYQKRPPVRPDAISFATTVAAWARSGHDQAPERATDLLRRMTDPFHVLGQLQISPNTTMFNSLLTSWARSGREGAGEQVYRLLMEMEESPDSSEQVLKPDHISYSIVADAFAKQGNPKAAEKVVAQLLQKYRETKEETLRPSVQIFTSVMDGWTRSNDPNKEQYARAVLDEIQKLRDEGILPPDSDTWMKNTILEAILTSSSSSLSPGDRAERGHEFLEQMKTEWKNKKDNAQAPPNAWSYSSVIIAHLDAGNLHRAEQVLQESFGEAGIAMSLKTPARVIHALAKNNQVHSADVWLHRVFDGCEKGMFGFDEKPAASLLGGVVAAWQRVANKNTHSDAGIRAQSLVTRMQQLSEKGLTQQPDPLSFRNLPKIWLKTGGEDRAYQAIQYMRKRADEGAVEMIPNASHYGGLIRAYSVSNRPEKAESVLVEMLRDYLNDSQRAKPDVEHFNNVLLGWSSTNVDDKNGNSLVQIDGLIQRMKELSYGPKRLEVWPNRRTYHFAMTLCAKRADTLLRIQQYFEEMRQSFLAGNIFCKPNEESYDVVIQALCRAERPELAQAYLQDACNQFQVGTLESPPFRHCFHNVIMSWERRVRRPEPNRRVPSHQTTLPGYGPNGQGAYVAVPFPDHTAAQSIHNVRLLEQSVNWLVARCQKEKRTKCQ